MSTSKKPSNVDYTKYSDMKKQRDMWREDFNGLYSTIMSLSFWQRLKFLFKRGDI